jgi:hypothetical protein
LSADRKSQAIGMFLGVRRWLSILLLVLLPFQFSWPTAASCCPHETGKLSSHFGHHEHKHEGAKVKASDNERGDKAEQRGPGSARHAG